MSKEIIYTKLRDNGLTHEGACALMGNMMAESGLKANIAQRGMTKLSDEEYTTQADAGIINFVRDSVGYGLCQWTYWARKSALLEFAKEYSTSVGDEEMQVDFVMHELKTTYPALLQLLKTSTDLQDLTSKICTQYERPAVNNIATRVKFAESFKDLTYGAAQETEPAESKMDEIIALLEKAIILLRG